MIYGIDVWEGALNIDESIILKAGVKFIIPRLNDMNGGHHPDVNFAAEWEQSESFLRAPYFVYNPWVSGLINAQFLMDSLSTFGVLSQVTKIMDDIEVKKADYPPAEYADQMVAYYSYLARYKYSHLCYTGQWFLAYLSHWPATVDYCWARYPYYVYPDQKANISWVDAIGRINQLGWNPDPAKVCPGPIKVWQCTADRYILPGTADRPMDICISNLSWEQFLAWWGVQQAPGPVIATQDWAHAITNWARTMGYTGPEPE